MTVVLSDFRVSRLLITCKAVKFELQFAIFFFVFTSESLIIQGCCLQVSYFREQQ